MVFGEDCEIVVDEVTAFDAQKNGNSAIRARMPDVVSGRRENEIVRVNFDLITDSFDLIECPLHGRRSCERARRPDSEKYGAHAAIAQTRNIHRAFRVAKAENEATGDKPLG